MSDTNTELKGRLEPSALPKVRRIEPPHGTRMFFETVDRNGKEAAMYGVREMVECLVEIPGNQQHQKTQVDGTVIEFGPRKIEAHVARRNLTAYTINRIGEIAMK